MRPGWGIDMADRMEFYRRAYRNGIYSLETLINIYIMIMSYIEMDG